MFNATVAQNPTIPVSDGTKKRMNSAVVLNLLGVLSTGPNPPALLTVNHSSASPTISRNGAPTPSSTLIVSMPFQTTHMLTAQTPKKQTQTPPGVPAIDGHAIFAIDQIACPPIHVWMPNHPHATSARSTAGTFAPRTPNDAR